MRMAFLMLTCGVVLVPALSCQAADFNGSKPFLCATVDVSSCVPGDNCVRETPARVNAPQFFSVDVAKMQVTEAGVSGEAHSSKIGHADHVNGLLMLGGSEGVKAWVATVNETNGKLSYAVVGDRTAVVTFGACIAR